MNSSWTENSETQSIPLAPRHAAEPDPVAPPAVDPSGEPVIIAHAVTLILGALVTAGWVALPNATIDTIGTVVALALSTVAAVMARARVTPVQGGMWAAIGHYVADLVDAELARHQLPPLPPAP